MLYEMMRREDWWLRGRTWAERYAYLREWERLIAGSNKRFDWLTQRRRLNDEAYRILH